MPTILIAEDDAHLAEGLAFNLKRAGYGVETAPRGDAAVEMIKKRRPDLLILDIMMPGLSGFGVLEKLKSEKINIPIIILSAKSEELDKVRGFDLGAADYVTKPFSVAELLARVKARLGERAAGEESIAVEAGIINLTKMEFVSSAGSIPLTPTEIEILKCLRARAGGPVAREELLKAIWGCGPNSTRTLDAHVARLRKKIEIDAAQPRHLVTVHRVGYRFVGL